MESNLLLRMQHEQERARMNEVATTEAPPAPAAPKPQLKAGARPAGLVPTSMEEVGRLARVAIDSGLQVGTWKDTAEQKLPKAMMIILQGLELNVAPVQALNGIALINGRPSPWGKFARALVLRAGHKIEEWTTGEPYEGNFTSWCKVTRGDNGQITEKNFSVEDARDAGLWQTSPTVEKKDFKTGAKSQVPNDSPWFRYKKDMLAARAFSRAAIGVADALLGMELAEVARDVEDHRSDREPEDRGAIHAAPPPPLAAEIEARKPPVDDPAPAEPERKPSPPTPAEEKVPELAGPNMEIALKSFAAALGEAKTLDEAESALEYFNMNFDGHITGVVERRAAEMYEARISKL